MLSRLLTRTLPPEDRMGSDACLHCATKLPNPSSPSRPAPKVELPTTMPRPNNAKGADCQPKLNGSGASDRTCGNLLKIASSIELCAIIGKAF
jgi:hypothetical protein